MTRLEDPIKLTIEVKDNFHLDFAYVMFMGNKLLCENFFPARTHFEKAPPKAGAACGGAPPLLGAVSRRQATSPPSDHDKTNKNTPSLSPPSHANPLEEIVATA